jgi:hypothetical protein
MTSTLRSPKAFLGIVLLITLTVLASAQGIPAQSTGCIAVDRNDLPRKCTFLEEHGYCLWSALDSYEACKEDGNGILNALSCELGVQVDLLACNLGMPWRLLETILH